MNNNLFYQQGGSLLSQPTQQFGLFSAPSSVVQQRNGILEVPQYQPKQKLTVPQRRPSSDLNSTPPPAAVNPSPPPVTVDSPPPSIFDPFNSSRPSPLQELGVITQNSSFASNNAQGSGSLGLFGQGQGGNSGLDSLLSFSNAKIVQSKSAKDVQTPYGDLVDLDNMSLVKKTYGKAERFTRQGGGRSSF